MSAKCKDENYPRGTIFNGVTLKSTIHAVERGSPLRGLFELEGQIKRLFPLIPVKKMLDGTGLIVDSQALENLSLRRIASLAGRIGDLYFSIERFVTFIDLFERKIEEPLPPKGKENFLADLQVRYRDCLQALAELTADSQHGFKNVFCLPEGHNEKTYLKDRIEKRIIDFARKDVVEYKFAAKITEAFNLKGFSDIFDRLAKLDDKWDENVFRQ